MICLNIKSRSIHSFRFFVFVIFVLWVVTTPLYSQFTLDLGRNLKTQGDVIFNGETKVVSSSEFALGFEIPLFKLHSWAINWRQGFGRYDVVWEDDIKFSSYAFPLHFGASYYPLGTQKGWGPYFLLAMGITFISGDIDYKSPGFLGRVGFIVSMEQITNSTNEYYPSIQLSLGYRYDFMMENEIGNIAMPQVTLGLYWQFLKPQY